MGISLIISIDKDIVQIKNDKNIKFFGKGLINVFLKVCQYIYQPKKYYLIFKIVVPSLISHLLFVTFANSYLIVCISKIKLDI